MGSVWGHSIKVSLFGESHGAAIGCVIDGLPPGVTVDFAAVDAQMARRAPGRYRFSTPRRESDRYEVLSGLFHGCTTGAPLAVVIRNENTRSEDYCQDVLRPGHADYTAWVKFKGFADFRGGGHFSGRLTAPLVFAGAVVRQILGEQGIVLGSRILRIYDVEDEAMAAEEIPALPPDAFPVKSPGAKERMQRAIEAAGEAGDSVGGVAECVALNVPAGLGEPFFHSLESHLAALMFSVPAVKGVEFGDGFALAGMLGSRANDPMFWEDATGACTEAGAGAVKFDSNHNGGINGGIANGQPLVCRVAVKPTPSVRLVQKTVDIRRGESVETALQGRHDPCIVPRALPVLEAVMALGIYDLFVHSRKG
ncbi:MAG: chorismate synthase [Peptococcaceae bacterium]|nr:chorismate synthase [Peptococcaceae bacterium]